MKRAIILLLVSMLFAGCTTTTKPKENKAPAAEPAPVLRDPFRPDHPTREQVEAERAQKAAGKPQN